MFPLQKAFYFSSLGSVGGTSLNNSTLYTDGLAAGRSQQKHTGPKRQCLLRNTMVDASCIQIKPGRETQGIIWKTTTPHYITKKRITNNKLQSFKSPLRLSSPLYYLKCTKFGQLILKKIKLKLQPSDVIF